MAECVGWRHEADSIDDCDVIGQSLLAADKKLITDPIVEKAILKELKKPISYLTKADLEKVTELSLYNNQLTDVKGLEEQRTFKKIE